MKIILNSLYCHTETSNSGPLELPNLNHNVQPCRGLMLGEKSGVQEGLVSIATAWNVPLSTTWMSREKSITIFLRDNLWNSVGCWNNLPKQGYRDNHKPWLLHTRTKRNICRPNSNRLSCDRSAEYLKSEDTLQKVAGFLEFRQKIQWISMNQQDIYYTKIYKDGVCVKASPSIFNRNDTVANLNKTTSQSATVRYTLLASNASKVVVSVIWKQVAPHLPYLGSRSNSMFSSQKTLSGSEGTTDKGAMQQSTKLSKWNLLLVTTAGFSSNSAGAPEKHFFVMFFSRHKRLASCNLFGVSCRFCVASALKGQLKEPAPEWLIKSLLQNQTRSLHERLAVTLATAIFWNDFRVAKVTWPNMRSKQNRTVHSNRVVSRQFNI